MATSRLTPGKRSALLASWAFRVLLPSPHSRVRAAHRLCVGRPIAHGVPALSIRQAEACLWLQTLCASMDSCGWQTVEQDCTGLLRHLLNLQVSSQRSWKGVRQSESSTSVFHLTMSAPITRPSLGPSLLPTPAYSISYLLVGSTIVARCVPCALPPPTSRWVATARLVKQWQRHGSPWLCIRQRAAVP